MASLSSAFTHRDPLDALPFQSSIIKRGRHSGVPWSVLLGLDVIAETLG